jgi:hypothetical protein
MVGAGMVSSSSCLIGLFVFAKYMVSRYRASTLGGFQYYGARRSAVDTTVLRPSQCHGAFIWIGQSRLMLCNRSAFPGEFGHDGRKCPWPGIRLPSFRLLIHDGGV